MIGLILLTLLGLQDPTQPLKRKKAPEVKIVSTKLDRREAKPGEIVNMRVELSISSPYHIYPAAYHVPGAATSFEFQAPFTVWGIVGETTNATFREEAVFEKTAAFDVPVLVREDAKPGDSPINLSIKYQACDDKNCYPGDLPVEFTIKVLEGAVDAPMSEVRIASVKPDKKEAKVGEIVKVKVTVLISQPHHLYPAGYKMTAAATQFTFEGPFEVRGKIEEKPNATFEKDEVFEKLAEFVIPVLIKDGAKPGPLEMKLKLAGQACDDRNCWPVDATASVGLTILEGRVEPPPKQDVRSKGLGAFLIACVIGGLISLVMPCVYPLIPITLKFFITQSHGSRARSFGLASLYGLGIIVTFTGIGFGLSKLLGADGAQTFSANPWVNLSIAALFTVLALSFFGLFELRLPSFITNRVAGGAPKQGALGAFGLGLVFAIVSFTCTIPIAATLMALAATGQGTWAFFGMLVYSGTMALPFIFLGFFPDLIKNMPKSGGWLHTITICAGFLEVALATKYLANSDFSWGWGLLSRTVIVAIWSMVCLFTATYLLDFWRMPEDQKQESTGLGRLFWAFLFGALGIFLIGGLAGRHLRAFEILLPIDPGVIPGSSLARMLVLSLAVTVLAFATTWALDLWRFRGSERRDHVGMWRMLGSFSLGTFASFLVAGLMGRPLGAIDRILPKDFVTVDLKKAPELASLEEGLTLAKKESKPVFLEFTGFS